jgi:hypothetical protein
LWEVLITAIQLDDISYAVSSMLGFRSGKIKGKCTVCREFRQYRIAVCC